MSKCYVRMDKMIEPSFDFLENIERYGSKSPRTDIVAIEFYALTNNRFIRCARLIMMRKNIVSHDIVK